MADPFRTEAIQGTSPDKARILSQQTNAASRFAIIQEAQAEDFQQWADELNPVSVITRNFAPLEQIKVRGKKKEEEAEKAEKNELEEVVEIENIQAISEQFEEKNPELFAKSLQLLRSRVKKGDSSEDIVKKTLEAFPDHSLADEALEFLSFTTKGQLKEEVAKGKEHLNTVFGREVKAGKNISSQARQFSKDGLGTPTGLRDLYREITGNPREAITLFEELSNKYPFEKMKTVISFLMHSLGADLKAKGPSIPHGELHRLITETRSLQAILGVYRFFALRMNIIHSTFDRRGLPQHPKITFEMLAKLFVKFLIERYPSADKVYQMGVQLGISDDILAEIIIFSQMRDAVRQVAPKLYRGDQHRSDILKVFLDAIDALEDKLDEEEEDEEKKDNGSRQ